MRREPKPFPRCRACGARSEPRRCQSCGSDRIGWAFQFDVHQPGEPRRQVKRSGYESRTRALAAMRELQRMVEVGEPEPTNLTTGQWLDQWLAGVRTMRGGTRANYELAIRRHLKPSIGRVPLRSLTRAAVRELYARLEESGSARGGGLSVKSVHNVHIVLHTALKAAVADGLIPRNPAADAHSLPGGRGEMRVWDAAEVSAFLASVKQDRLFALWRLAAVTGMRRGELLGLRWRDVDLDGGFVTIQQQRVRQGASGVTYGPPKTARGRRRVPIDAATAEALRAHRAAQEVVPIDGLVFTRADGAGLDPDGVSGAFERLSGAAGLTRIRLHDLRHTAATLMLRAGAHPKVVQERLGHSSVAMTLDLYSHAVPSMGVEAADQIAALVDGSGS